MAGPVKVEASADKLEMLVRLRAQKAELDAQRMTELDVWSLIGYSPNCLPVFAVRKQVAARMGIEDPFDRRVTESGELPAPCGQCPQEQFHAATEFDCLMGGAAGGGKSIALVAEGLRACVRFPGLRVLLIRRSYDELEESIFPALRKFSYGQALGAKWNGVKRELRFPNLSLFRFRYLESVDDASRRHGGEYQLVLCDELSLLPPGLLDFIRYERIRSGGGQPVIGVRATSNPGGPSHGEVKERYIENTDYGKKTYRDEHGHTVRFVPARVEHNPHLDPGYVKRLDAIPDPARRAAMRDGDWDQFAGMIFKELSRERHLLEPFELPSSWVRYASVDWGYTAPWAVLWAAVDEDWRVWLYREIYATQVGEADQAKMILEAECNEQVTARYADDAMWAVRGGDVKPLAHVYADNGVHLTPAGKGPGSRVQGWQRIHSFLADAPACPHHRSLGETACPRLHIFSNVRHLWSELKNLPYDTALGHTEDADPKASDHAADALRYLLTNIEGGTDWLSTEIPPATGLPGAAKPLAPMGAWAVKAEQLVPSVRHREPDAPVQGAVMKSPYV